MRESLNAHIDSNEKFEGLLTKVLCSQKRWKLVNNILHDV